MTGDRATHDDAGAIQVVEAILVAVLVAGALIFFALAQRPALPSDPSASQDAQLARDVLATLQGAHPGDSNDQVTSFANDLTSNPNDPTAKGLFRDAVAKLLPFGMLFRLQGVNTTQVVWLAEDPFGAPTVQAQGAATVVVAGGQVQRVELVVWDVF